MQNVCFTKKNSKIPTFLQMSDKPPISKRETTPPSRTQSTRKSTRSRGERTALSANAEEIQLQRCKICKWSGKSLRCHLRRNSQCAKDYDKQALEKQANTARKKKKADWESANRKQRTERDRRRIPDKQVDCH